MKADEILRSLWRSFPLLTTLPPHSYIVGGAVRDVLWEVEPFDVDVVVSGGEEAAHAFAARAQSRLVILGREPMIAWRTTAGGKIYDFTTLSGRSIEDDLARRDFTINAVAVGPIETPRLADPFGGVEDLRTRTLRMVREENFIDDPLRMLRAVRFAAIRQMQLDDQTADAIRRHAVRIIDAAPERVRAELDQMLAADAGRSLRLLEELGLAARVLPPDVVAAEELPDLDRADLVTRWAVLFSWMSREQVKEYSDQYRWSRDMTAEVTMLIELCATIRSASALDLRPRLYDAGRQTAERARTLFSVTGERDALRRLEEAVGAGSLFDTVPLLSGTEIAELTTVEPGPELGRVKRGLVEAQLREEVTTRDEAIALVRRIAREPASGSLRADGSRRE